MIKMTEANAQNNIKTRQLAHANASVLLEAKTLRETLQQLKKQMQIVVNLAAADQDRISSPQSDSNNSNEESEYDDSSNPGDEGSVVSTNKSMNGKIAPSPAANIRSNGLASVRQASVVVIGNMSNNGKGLSCAETLVRCGIKRLILFDLDHDASHSVEIAQRRWETEENPFIELETYVSAYSLDDDTFDHFLDRFIHGGEGDSPIQLVILTPCASSSNPKIRELILRGALVAGCRVLALREEDLAIAILDPSGHEIVINEPGITLANMALELLLSYS